MQSRFKATTVVVTFVVAIMASAPAHAIIACTGGLPNVLVRNPFHTALLFIAILITPPAIISIFDSKGHLARRRHEYLWMMLSCWLSYGFVGSASMFGMARTSCGKIKNMPGFQGYVFCSVTACLVIAYFLARVLTALIDNPPKALGDGPIRTLGTVFITVVVLVSSVVPIGQQIVFSSNGGGTSRAMAAAFRMTEQKDSDPNNYGPIRNYEAIYADQSGNPHSRRPARITQEGSIPFDGLSAIFYLDDNVNRSVGLGYGSSPPILHKVAFQGREMKSEAFPMGWMEREQALRQVQIVKVTKVEHCLETPGGALECVTGATSRIEASDLARRQSNIVDRMDCQLLEDALRLSSNTAQIRDPKRLRELSHCGPPWRALAERYSEDTITPNDSATISRLTNSNYPALKALACIRDTFSELARNAGEKWTDVRLSGGAVSKLSISPGQTPCGRLLDKDENLAATNSGGVAHMPGIPDGLPPHLIDLRYGAEAQFGGHAAGNKGRRQ